MIREQLIYSDYVIIRQHESKIDPRAKIDREEEVLCPRCNQSNSPIQHGKNIFCDCGLKMERFGNILQCTLDQEDSNG